MINTHANFLLVVVVILQDQSWHQGLVPGETTFTDEELDALLVIHGDILLIGLMQWDKVLTPPTRKNNPANLEK